jgi:hypothetical protein
MTSEELSQAIERALRQSPSVEVEGLGTFVRDEAGSISFRDAKRPRIFIAYAIEDAALADRLYAAFETRGFAPWLDRRKLLPGQNWPRRIEEAIANSDFFISCFSHNSVNKRGGFQAEVRYALDCARHVPLDDVFLIPARLDDCQVPARIQRETQYVDLFPRWDAGFARILRIIECQMKLVAA